MILKQSVWWRNDKYHNNEPVFVSVDLDMSGPKNWPDAVRGIDVDIDVGDPPSRDVVVKMMVANLRAEQGFMTAKIAQIDRQIAELQALEDKSE